MRRIGVYKVSALASYVVMEHSTIFIEIGDVTRGPSASTVETQVSRVY